jgi:hypothetical protein
MELDVHEVEEGGDAGGGDADNDPSGALMFTV